LLQKGESSEVYSKTLLEKSKKEFEQTNKPIYEALYAVGHFLWQNMLAILYLNIQILIKVKNYSKTR
jgi:hypothetical protein